ncbi:MAG: type II toxin-antitoxin system YafQ family toxin [Candidatus Omnitrophica bacterium]|nr:type II toxin-antitoxin system YafQ family toxin [Candidatus Omnitrophota bacterium]
MRIISPTRQFDRDLKKLLKRKKEISKLKAVVDLLSGEGRLPLKYKPHALVGDWIPCWDCHIEPDWLLIYQVTETHVYLFRIGSHSDLF